MEPGDGRLYAIARFPYIGNLGATHDGPHRHRDRCCAHFQLDPTQSAVVRFCGFWALRPGIESLALRVAEVLATAASRDRRPIISRAHTLKANRLRGDSFTGRGIDAGLRILEKVRANSGLPVTTDVHTAEEASYRRPCGLTSSKSRPSYLVKPTCRCRPQRRAGR